MISTVPWAGVMVCSPILAHEMRFRVLQDYRNLKATIRAHLPLSTRGPVLSVSVYSNIF